MSPEANLGYYLGQALGYYWGFVGLMGLLTLVGFLISYSLRWGWQQLRRR